MHVGSQEWSWTPPTNESLASAHMAFAAPTQINYVAKAAKVLDPRTPPSGAWDVVASSLRTSYLWDRVRVQVWMARSCLCVLLWGSHVTLELRCSHVYTHKANNGPFFVLLCLSLCRVAPTVPAAALTASLESLVAAPTGIPTPRQHWQCLMAPASTSKLPTLAR